MWRLCLLVVITERDPGVEIVVSHGDSLRASFLRGRGLVRVEAEEALFYNTGSRARISDALGDL